MTVPGFAVVGRPNKGKSSIVATLARDDRVYIDKLSGTTRRTQRFPMKVGQETLYVLHDTPGMQRARAVLGWLEANAGDAASRPAAVRRFLEVHRNDPRFQDECQMLEPIVAGAGIIYVVDGSCPYGAEYEPKMEILRWTGNPSLALINPIHNEHFVEDWRAGLGQYFQTVRVFNAQHAEFRKQLELLELFGHLDPDWREPLDRAVNALCREREEQHRSCATLIAAMIVESLGHCEIQPLLDALPESAQKDALLGRYRSSLVKAERRSRTQIEAVFHYTRLQRQEASMELDGEDLFNVENWYLWGLDRKALLTVATTSGAVVGGGAGLAVDAMTGGLLGGLGTLVSGIGGAVVGGAGALRYADDIADIKVKGLPTGGKRLTAGPSTNLNFPFVLLGRALQHHKLLARRTHAHRDVLHLDSALLETIDEGDRKALGRLFTRISRGRQVARQQAELATIVTRSMARADLVIKSS